MLFPTVTFAIFFVIVLPTSWLLMPDRHKWRLFAIAASYFFYGYWNWRFVGLIVASTLWNQAFARGMRAADDERVRRALLGVAVAGNLGALAFFKYWNFFVESTRSLLGGTGLETGDWFLEITLPVGISFFTFQALSYVIDVYRREIEPVPLLDFAVYLAFFPQLVAGPIVRATEFLPQLLRRKDPRRVDAGAAFFLIAAGLFKKVVLADFLASEIVDPVYGNPEVFSPLESLVATYGFAVQIYCDFSGYTDIAIGCALLLGFRFPQNFDAPYTATSIRDFWRRWHMTLSRWLRDYLYVPLGGNRGGPLATYRNLFLTMLLGGLWHGAEWTFVVWGALHGVYLVFEHWRADERAAEGLPEPADTPWRLAGRRLLTFHLVLAAWVLFRAETFSGGWEILQSLPRGVVELLVSPLTGFAAWSDSELLAPSVALAIVVGIGMQYLPRDLLGRAQVVFSRLSPAMMGLMMGVGLLAIDALGPQGVSEFIYFQF